MGCCKKIIHRYSTSHGGVFCLNWVLPIRVLTIASLALHLLYKFCYPPPPFAGFITIGHVVIAVILLAECQRSIRYHKAIKELEALGDRRRALIKK